MCQKAILRHGIATQVNRRRLKPELQQRHRHTVYVVDNGNVLDGGRFPPYREMGGGGASVDELQIHSMISSCRGNENKCPALPDSGIRADAARDIGAIPMRTSLQDNDFRSRRRPSVEPGPGARRASLLQESVNSGIIPGGLPQLGGDRQDCRCNSRASTARSATTPY